ncbi:hypothetical protein SY85_14190 [Flavisolibacter tropicus]|uniref:CARDB domain-containing protein n=2 Tax=Flavisolibacter tropicus TaxID=1492898 RepID=A0A172TX78_9BACT|nr:hypothetical protein SY85_14190 [Flavisolibacter tropicus]
MDTMAVKQYAAGLEKQLQTNAGDSSTAKQLRLANNYLQACSYFEGAGWSWAVKATGLSAIKRYYVAADMLKEIVADPSNPLYYKALYLRGRLHYWLGKEDRTFYPDTVSEKHFTLLSSKFPDHSILQMYRGTLVPFAIGVDLKPVDGAPLWAVYQREAMYRMLHIINWWVKEKQTANGELGGKYGDDVEILRWWLPAILGADDSTATLGYTRLADGVWNSEILERGFAKRVDDVEHSAELFRDTHPAMFLIKYGDPEYVERCMYSMQNFTGVWTGLTPRGHRHFKSYYLSATQVREEEPYGVDVPLNARAVLPGLWLAWYNKNPQLLQSFSEWCNAWVEDAEREENGKPAGVFPAAIAFTSDKIGGYTGTWYDANLTYPYYRWESLGHVGELYNHLLGMYAITRNENFLRPLQSVVKIMQDSTRHASQSNPGSFEWVKDNLSGNSNEGSEDKHPLSKLFAMAKKVTTIPAFDNLVLQYGQPYNKYDISNNQEEIIKGFGELLNSLRYNFPLLTSEVKFTDRVYVPGSNLLFGMYTGHFGSGFEYPALVATWKNTGADVSVFVRRGNTTSATVSLFNAGKQKQVEMRTWLVAPGLYKLKAGIDTNDDGVIDELKTDKEIVLVESVNTISLDVPSKMNWVVSLEQISTAANTNTTVADLAIADRDIQLPSAIVPGQTIEVTATVHNIGNLIAQDVEVHLIVDGKKVDSKKIDAIEAPNDLHPRMKEVKWQWLAQRGRHSITIEVDTKQKEITKQNNHAVRMVSVKSK